VTTLLLHPNPTMLFKNFLLFGLLSVGATAKLSEPTPDETIGQHLDVEMIVDGIRELFPLLPGTKCPPGLTCRVRNVDNVFGQSPMIGSLKNNLKKPLAMTMNWHELNNELTTVVDGSHRCSRRQAMAKAAGMVAGVSAATASLPAYAAETVQVKMGSDSGLLVFVPQKISICKGDTVKWTNNKSGPHNVVFDEDAIPAGVSQEAISMDEQLGEEGDTFSMKFDTPGTYDYYCEPHRGAGMQAQMTVV